MNGHLRDLVAPLVDGQLDHDTRERALVHMTHCAPCQREVAAQRALKLRLSSLGAPDLPSPLVNRIVGLNAPLGSGAPPASASRAPGTSLAPGGPLTPGARPRLGPARGPAFAFPIALPTPRIAIVRPSVVVARLAASSSTAPAPAVAAAPATPARSAAAVRSDRRRTARRTVLGSAAAVVLTVGGGATLAGGGGGAASGVSAPVSPTPTAAVAVERGLGGRSVPVLRPLPGAPMFDTVSISFAR